MSADQADDFDDVPRLMPLPQSAAERALRDDYRDRLPRRKPGFGFWLAVLWTLLYFFVTQFVLGVAFGIVIIPVALFLDGQLQGNGMPDLNAWMKSPAGSSAVLVLVACTQFGGLALSLLLLRLWCGKPWKRKIALSRLPTPTHAILMLIGFPAMIALAALVEVPIREYIPTMQELLKAAGAPKELQMEGTTELILAIVKDAPWVLAIFVVGVTPGICEEVFCRGFLGQGLSGRYRTVAVVGIVSFLFGCLHADPQQGVGAMCLGLAIHFAYVATRSLLVAMVVHFANNSLAVLHVNTHTPFAGVLDPLEQVMKSSPILFIASTVALFSAVAYALYQTRCKLVAVEPELPVWEPEGVSGVELPPPNSGTIVTHDPLSVGSAAAVLVSAIAFGLVLAFG
jgi:membrane protease YdiL (CAAX protease family)